MAGLSYINSVNVFMGCVHFINFKLKAKAAALWALFLFILCILSRPQTVNFEFASVSSVHLRRRYFGLICIHGKQE